ncbi:hypothetical protein Peur_030631 [Populus x canadensis]
MSFIWYSCVQDDVVFGAPNLVKYWLNVVSRNKWLDMVNGVKRFCNGRDNNIPRSMDNGCFNHHRLIDKEMGRFELFKDGHRTNLLRVRI